MTQIKFFQCTTAVKREAFCHGVGHVMANVAVTQRQFLDAGSGAQKLLYVPSIEAFNVIMVEDQLVQVLAFVKCGEDEVHT